MTDVKPSSPLAKVTVAIPTLNRAGYLRLALESALGQSYGNLEVIVSNNASTDETSGYLASCADCRLHVIEQATRLSMTENWNACLAAATGEYFLLLSDDDLLEPDAIQELVAGYAVAEGDATTGFVYCGARVIDSAGDVVRDSRTSPPLEAARDLIPEALEGKRDVWFCAVLLRTEDILPGFPPNYKVACDAAVWIRAAMRRGPAVFVAKPLVRYRQHQSLSTTTHFDVWRAEIRQLHQLAIAEDRRTGKPDAAFARRMDAVAQRVDRNVIAGGINQSYGRNKGRALLEYARRLRAFLSPTGVVFLGRSLILLFLSEESRVWIRRKLRRQPAG